MLRFLSRFVGTWLSAAALVVVVIDGAKSIAASAPVVTPLEDLWRDLAPASLDSARLAVQEDWAQPWLWDLLSAGPLAAPAWLVLGALGLLLVIVGRKRRERSIGQATI